MTNELLLIISLAASFGGLLVFFCLFGKTGCSVWIALCTVLANIEVAVLIKAFGMEQTLGNTLFASSFLATDFLSEFYGKKEAGKAVKIGIATSCVFILFSALWPHYAPASGDRAMAAVKTLFSGTPRILASSLIAYAVSELLDVRLYHALWDLTKKKSGSGVKYLWLRNNVATLASQAVNIVLFNFGAFFGVYDMKTLAAITASCYAIYIVTSIADTPFLYIARKIHAMRTSCGAAR